MTIQAICPISCCCPLYHETSTRTWIDRQQVHECMNKCVYESMWNQTIPQAVPQPQPATLSVASYWDFEEAFIELKSLYLNTAEFQPVPTFILWFKFICIAMAVWFLPPAPSWRQRLNQCDGGMAVPSLSLVTLSPMSCYLSLSEHLQPPLAALNFNRWSLTH